jgi:hypothetical protein
MIANTDVLKQLASLCHEAETGTFFITTIDNKACHILIDKGRIKALSYGRKRGEAVIPELPFIKIERFSFQQGVSMPLSTRSFVGNSKNVLASLGLHHVDQQSVSGKRMYRGLEVETKNAVPTMQKGRDAVPAKKPPRMYRGRPLED